MFIFVLFQVSLGPDTWACRWSYLLEHGLYYCLERLPFQEPAAVTNLLSNPLDTNSFCFVKIPIMKEPSMP